MLMKSEWIEFWMIWQWQWFASFNFKGPVSWDYVMNGFKNWRMELCKDERLQIAYQGLLNHKPMSHLHLLMFGKNRHGKVLSDVDSKKWERRWKGDAKIVPVYEKQGVIEYLVNCNMPKGQYHLLEPYNIKLLKTTMAPAS